MKWWPWRRKKKFTPMQLSELYLVEELWLACLFAHYKNLGEKAVEELLLKGDPDDRLVPTPAREMMDPRTIN